MDRDTLYFHFANLVLVLIGLLSVQAIFNPFVFAILVMGTILGFIISWQIKDARLRYMDIFIGMLSLAAVVVIFGRLYDISISFENLLKIFAISLAWLTLFQSFGLKTGKSYAMMQFISLILLITSVGIALEQEGFYTALFALFLFLFIFIMRLSLVCEKKRKGSMIVGDQEKIMGLWQQIKISAIMFSLVVIIASFVYPFVPRFENMSFRTIPSTLLGRPEQVPVPRLVKNTPQTLKENKKIKKEQRVDDLIKKRETAPRDESVLEIEGLTIKADKKEIPPDGECILEAELKFRDGTAIDATRLVDWKVEGTAGVLIDREGTLSAKKQGYVNISASYLKDISNEVHLVIMKPLAPTNRRSWRYYLIIVLVLMVMIVLAYFFILIFMRSRRLSELAVNNPREFIKEMYASLCRGFKFYGVPRLDFISPREFLRTVTGHVSVMFEPMHAITELVLEASFSEHQISVEQSQETLESFHEVTALIMERRDNKLFFKKVLFGLFLLDVFMMSKNHASVD